MIYQFKTNSVVRIALYRDLGVRCMVQTYSTDFSLQLGNLLVIPLKSGN